MPPRAAKPAANWAPSQRRLIRLEDNGPSHVLSPELFDIQSRDRSWNLYAQGFLTANRPQLNELSIQAQFTAGSEQVELALRPSGSVGAIPLHSPITQKIVGGIVVKPRFGWAGIGPLLHQIGWTASPRILERPLVPGSAREVPPWVLAGPILQRFAQLVRELQKGFRMVEETRSMPRGQILWPQYLRQMASGKWHQIACRFPELGPDQILRAYLRWGVEQVHQSLAPWAALDVIARSLTAQAEGLVWQLRDTPSRAPDKPSLDRLILAAGLPSAALLRGLEALGWVVDERGLAGTAQMDGLAWVMPMADLFERWVEHLVRTWAAGFGGQVTVGRKQETLVPITWNRRGVSSLGSLVPDILVRHGATAWIFDAKYKRHFEELDHRDWMDLQEEVRESHRHDIHQVLAYAATTDAEAITSVLVYPIRLAAWEQLAERNATVATAILPQPYRQVTLILCAVPLEQPRSGVREITERQWQENLYVSRVK